MGLGDFWIQSNNAKRERLQTPKEAFGKERLDPKYAHLFDFFDKDRNGKLNAEEMEFLSYTLSAASGDNILTSAESKTSIFSDLGEEKADFLEFVKAISDAVKYSKTEELPNGEKRIITEYKNGITDTIYYYPNGDFKFKVTEKKIFATIDNPETEFRKMGDGLSETRIKHNYQKVEFDPDRFVYLSEQATQEAQLKNFVFQHFIDTNQDAQKAIDSVEWLDKAGNVIKEGLEELGLGKDTNNLSKMEEGINANKSKVDSLNSFVGSANYSADLYFGKYEDKFKTTLKHEYSPEQAIAFQELTNQYQTATYLNQCIELINKALRELDNYETDYYQQQNQMPNDNLNPMSHINTVVETLTQLFDDKEIAESMVNQMDMDSKGKFNITYLTEQLKELLNTNKNKLSEILGARETEHEYYDGDGIHHKIKLKTKELSYDQLKEKYIQEYKSMYGVDTVPEDVLDKVNSSKEWAGIVKIAMIMAIQMIITKQVTPVLAAGGAVTEGVVALKNLTAFQKVIQGLIKTHGIQKVSNGINFAVQVGFVPADIGIGLVNGMTSKEGLTEEKMKEVFIGGLYSAKYVGFGWAVTSRMSQAITQSFSKIGLGSRLFNSAKTIAKGQKIINGGEIISKLNMGAMHYVGKGVAVVADGAAFGVFDAATGDLNLAEATENAFKMQLELGVARHFLETLLGVKVHAKITEAKQRANLRNIDIIQDTNGAKPKYIVQSEGKTLFETEDINAATAQVSIISQIGFDNYTKLQEKKESIKLSPKSQKILEEFNNFIKNAEKDGTVFLKLLDDIKQLDDPVEVWLLNYSILNVFYEMQRSGGVEKTNDFIHKTSDNKFFFKPEILPKEYEEFKKIVSSIENERAIKIAFKEAQERTQNGDENTNIRLSIKSAIEFLQLYKIIQDKINALEDVETKNNLQDYLDNYILSEHDYALNFRKYMARDMIKNNFAPVTHSEKLIAKLRITDLRAYVEIGRPIELIKSQEHVDLKNDLAKLDKADELVEQITKAPKSKEAEKLYEKYLEEENIANNKIKDLCKKINRELGVKIILPSNIKEAGVVLELIYQELYNFKMRAEANGKKANLPTVLNFLTSNLNFLELQNEHETKNAFYNKDNNALYIRGMNTESVKRFLRHELIHANITLKEFPKDFDPIRYIDEFLKAGVSIKEIMKMMLNPDEFLPGAMDGNTNEYSKPLKTIMVELGLPKWILDMNTSSLDKPYPVEKQQTIKQNIIRLLEHIKSVEKEQDAIFYSSRPRSSIEIQLDNFKKFRKTYNNVLQNNKYFSNKTYIQTLLDDADFILNNFDQLSNYSDAEIKTLTDLLEKLKIIKFMGITIDQCSDINKLKNSGGYFDIFDRGSNVSQYTLNTPDIEIEKRLKAYINDPNIRSNDVKITLLLNWCRENLLEKDKFYPNVFPKLIAITTDSKGNKNLITVEDFCSPHGYRHLTKEDVAFFADKDTKCLQKLLIKNQKVDVQGRLLFDSSGNPIYENGEFEKIEHMYFGILSSIQFKMKIDPTTNQPPTYEEAWKAIEYAFKHKFDIDNIIGYSSWELQYTSRNIDYEFNIKPRSSGNNTRYNGQLDSDWNEHDKKGNPVLDAHNNFKPIALKYLYNNGYDAIIDNLIDGTVGAVGTASSGNIWNVPSYPTFFKSIHARARFIQRLILKGSASNYADLNHNRIRQEVANFTAQLNNYMTNSPTIYSYLRGKNPNIEFNYIDLNGSVVCCRIGFSDDGSIKTIIDI